MPLALLLAVVARGRAQARADSTARSGARELIREVPTLPGVPAPSVSWGADVVTIDSAEIESSAAQSFSELLQARAPGLSVMRSGGSVGEGSRVRLRGPVSLLGGSEPLLVVDGVRMEASQARNLTGISNVYPSLLDDLVPGDLERIDVRRGPAAASLYGPGAAGGVLVVTTKRGRPGGWHWRVRGEGEAPLVPTNFPANYQLVSLSPITGQPTGYCDLAHAEAQQCSPTRLDVWNPLVQASPFHSGRMVGGHIAVDGGFEQTGIYASVTGRESRGVEPHDEESRLGVRGSVVQRLPRRVEIEATGSYLRRTDLLPVEGNVVLPSNVLMAGLLGSAEADSNRGYFSAFGPFLNDSVYPHQDVRRWGGSVQARWQALPWLDASVLWGRDHVQERDVSRIFGVVQPQSPAPESWRADDGTTTLHGLVAASYRPWAHVSARSTVSVDAWRVDHLATDSVMAPTGSSSSEASLHDRWSGVSFAQQLAWEDRVFVNAALARLKSGLTGGNTSKLYPSVNGSWLLPHVRALSELRLRVAYGEASGPSPAELPIGISPPSPVPILGQPNVERTKELEGGFDATVGGRTFVEVTGFRSHSTRLLYYRPAPPQAGVPVGSPEADIVPGAEMRNDGVEATVATSVTGRGHVRWDVSVSVATLSNRVVRLDVPGGEIGQNTITVAGYPLGGYWAMPYTYQDTNGDRLIERNEVHLGTQRTYLGPPLPTVESALESRLAVPGGIVLSVLFDYRGGQKQYNLTEYMRCGGFVEVCRGAQDPAAPLAQQAAAMALRLGSGAGFIQDGSFVKLREASIRWAVPRRLSGAIGGAVITVAGRNLATWTRYQGIDPEVSYVPPNSLPPIEFLKSPLPREVLLRVDLGRSP